MLLDRDAETINVHPDVCQRRSPTTIRRGVVDRNPPVRSPRGANSCGGRISARAHSNGFIARSQPVGPIASIRGRGTTVLR